MIKYIASTMKMLRNIAATLLLTLAPAAARAQTPDASQSQAPKYIFYMIGDGMGLNHVLNAQHFNKMTLGADSLLLMMRFPVASVTRTHSASSPVTDSAAAGTALATGSKTRNNMLGMNADTVAVNSIAKILFDKGWGVGLVTSVGIDDATPGAFFAHVPSRHDKMDVARQLAESGYQYAAGAGLAKAYDKEGNSTGLVDYFAEQGVKVVYGREGLEAEADRLLLLSANTDMRWNIGYAVDSIPDALTLPEMTTAAINQLLRVSPEHFFVMIEGGSIDHAGHANDGGTIVREILAFDQAIAKAYAFYLAHPDETLIVVTADHETGGFSVGNNFTGYNVNPSATAYQKISKEAFNNHIKGMAKDRRVYRWPDMEEYLTENLGLGKGWTLTEEETDELSRMFEDMMAGRNIGADQQTLYATFDGFSARVFELLNEKAGFGFTSTRHTGAMVPVFAVGVGAGQFAGVNDNTDLPRKILSIAQGDK